MAALESHLGISSQTPTLELSTFATLMDIASPLLALPAEIRNMIYRLLLVCPQLTFIRRSFSRNYYSDYVLPSKIFHTALLRTCRQIRAEAAPILYGENTFSAHPSLLTGLPFLINSFRPIRTAHVAAQIRRWYVHVRLDCDLNYSRAQATKAFAGADELEIEVYQAMFGGSDYTNLMLFKDVRGVRRAKVGGSVRAPFARWLELSLTAPFGAEVPPFDDKLFDAPVVGRYDVWAHGGR